MNNFSETTSSKYKEKVKQDYHILNRKLDFFGLSINLTSWSLKETKFVTVFGAVFPNNPNIIRPAGLFPIEISRNIFLVTKVA